MKRFLHFALAVLASASWPGLAAPSQVFAVPAPITLDEAISRARRANTAYAAALNTAGIAQAQKGIAQAAILPNVVYHNQFLYTQGQGVNATAQTTTPVRFIANNSVHEYISQGSVTQTISGASITNYRKANADAAVARALLEVASRGLVVTTIANYYGVLASQAKLAVAQRALSEAERFF